MTTLTESQLYEIAEQISTFGMQYKYKMTPAELGWLDFVRGRYSIAEYLLDRLEGDIVTLDDGLSRALDDDCSGAGKAVCLSDDSDLQAIFFYSYSEE